MIYSVPELFSQLPPKVEYSLTDFGETLIPVINMLAEWGNTHQDRLRKVLE